VLASAERPLSHGSLFIRLNRPIPFAPARGSMSVLEVLSLLFLAFQAALPWLCGGFPAMDGPSHLATAVVAKDLLRGSGSAFHPILELAPVWLPNWATTVTLGVLTSVFDHPVAERVLVTLSVVLVYMGFGYCARPQRQWRPECSIVINSLLHVWFLFMGFWGFYAGAGLGLLCLGYSRRRLDRLEPHQAAGLGAGLLVLFYCHPLPYVMTVSIIVAWVLQTAWRTLPGAAGRHDVGEPRHGIKAATTASLLLPWGALGPSLALAAAHFAHGGGRGAAGFIWQGNPLSDLVLQLQQAFWVSAYPHGDQAVILGVLLVLWSASLLGTRPRGQTSWSASGTLATGIAAALLALAPDRIAGGAFVRARLAWMALSIGVVLALGDRRLRRARVAVEVVLSLLLALSLARVATLTPRVNAAVEDYRDVLRRLPVGCRFVVVKGEAPRFEMRFAGAGLPFRPLEHVEDYAVVDRGCLNLSGHQFASAHFSVRFRAAVRELGLPVAPAGLGWRQALSETEARWSRLGFPPDHVVLYGESPPDASVGVGDWTDWTLPEPMRARYRVLAEAGTPPFVRIYRRLANK